MLICFAPVFTRGMKINYATHILRQSEMGTLKTNPYNLPLNRERTKMPSSTYLGPDSLAPFAVSSRRQSVLLDSAVSQSTCQAFASHRPCLAPGPSWRAGTALPLPWRLQASHPSLHPQLHPPQGSYLLSAQKLLFPVFRT